MCGDSFQRTPLATWNAARGVWETARVGLCGHAEVWSETWPASAMWDESGVYELLTSEHPTDGSGCSSAHGLLLKTPTAQLAVNGGSQDPAKRKMGGHGPTLADEVEHLLPTPRATDGEKGDPNQRGSSGDLMLPSAVMSLLPTPSAGNFNDGESVESWKARRDREKTKGRNGNGIGTPLAMAVKLLPTHRVSATRTSRSAALNSSSSPSLDQAIELARGILPKEFNSWEEMPPSWIGVTTDPPSRGGN